MRHKTVSIGLLVLLSAFGGDVVAGGAKMYWSANFGEGDPLGVINRANLSGSSPEKVYMSTGAFIAALAFDDVSGELYWAQGFDGDIWLGDGQGCAPLFQRDVFVKDLAVDSIAAKLYWRESPGAGQDDQILRSNPDGSGVETVLTGVFLSGFGIGINPIAETIYWTVDNGNASEIRSAGYDGQNVQTVVQLNEQTRDVAVDPLGGKIYWADRDFVRRADLDGANEQAIVPTIDAFNGVGAIAVDPGGGKVYWSEFGVPDSPIEVPARIRRADLDGSNAETLIQELGPGVAAAQSLALDASGSLEWACGSEPLIIVPASGAWAAGILASLLLGLTAWRLRSRSALGRPVGSRRRDT